MKKLHALLIGIDSYPVPVRPLKGCVNDANAVDAYLSAFCKSLNWQYAPLKLLNEKATRSNIIDGYDIFQSANDGDTCVVYYSGHGSRIKAAKEFWTETDGMNETIVCYDARSVKGSRDLIDKELAFLAWKATQNKDVHFVEIMDCCFSGGNTRAAGDEYADDRFETPQYEGPPVVDYLGYNITGAYQISNLGVAAPTSRRIHLSASKADETSKEKVIGDQRRGIFTWALLKSLEAHRNDISYTELVEHTHFLVQQGVFELKSRFGGQSPQLDQNGISPYSGFLTGDMKSAANRHLAGFDPDKGWHINAGSIHGLPDHFDITISYGDKEFPIRQVFPTYAVLDFPDTFDKQKVYPVTVSKLVRQPIRIAFSLTVDKDIKASVEQLFDPAIYPYFEFSENGNFQILQAEDKLQLARTGQLTPLFPAVNLDDLEDFLHKINKVSKWQSTLDTQNPRTGPLKEKIEVSLSIYQAGDAYNKNYFSGNIKDSKVRPVLYYEKYGDVFLNPKFGLTLTNNTNQSIWFNVLYLSTGFGITTVNQGKKEVPPGKSFILEYNNDSKIPVSINSDMRKMFHVTEITDWVKVMWSTEEFDTLTYQQSAISFLDVRTKDIGADTSVIQPEPVKDWGSFNIPLNIVYPVTDGVVSEQNDIVTILDHQLKVPKGFSAKVSVISTEEGTRSTGIGWPAILDQDMSGEYEMSRSVGSTPPGSVIEFSDVQGAASVNEANPIEINLPKSLESNESLWVFGFDQESGMYYPVGMESTPSQVRIHTLPDPSDDQQRSVGGSIKLFLKKITFNKSREILLGKPVDDRKLYRLAFAHFNPENEETIYESDISLLREKVEKSKKVVLCIHGILGDTAHMVRSLYFSKKEDGSEIYRDYDLILSFDYENLNTPIERLAALLKDRLAEAGFAENDDKELFIMAHSMGGLVSRYFIEKLEGDKIVTKLLQLGTPNQGSEWANVAQLAGVLMTHVVNFTSLVKPAQWALQGLGKLAKEGQVNLMNMHPDSDFMKKLNDGTRPPVPYTIIAGDMRLVNTAAISSFWSRFFTRLGYMAVKWLFDEANDIAVSRKHMIGEKDDRKHVIDLACDHLNYFYDPETLKAIAREL